MKAANSEPENFNRGKQADKEGDAPIQWVYINGLGERDFDKVSQTDVLSTIAFDKSGEFLAVGDHGGRVIIFRYANLKSSRYFDYKYFAEIQSHEPDFDHLKSIELNEKINSLEFLYGQKQDTAKLLSTNDRIIKLWNIEARQTKEVYKNAYL